MSTGHGDAEDYVARATSRAVAGAAEGFSRQGGRLLGSESWQDEHGHWLKVRGTLDAHHGVEVHYARVVLLASGPDKDAETEATIYSSGFEERLHTRAPHIVAVDGVITL